MKAGIEYPYLSESEYMSLPHGIMSNILLHDCLLNGQGSFRLFVKFVEEYLSETPVFDLMNIITAAYFCLSYEE
ncbi:MAG: hypothetical protein LUC94_05350 [Clostridiales bacterium]|nr:hypothetical protein [Clostridiales bacterium]